MKCEICGADPAHGGAPLYRQNAPGEKAVWRCLKHSLAPADPEVDEITAILQQWYNMHRPR